MPFIGTQPEVGGYSVLDALTASATASYTLQKSSANFVPSSENNLLVSLNGVIQKAGSSFTVSGSTLTFSSALDSSDSIDFILAMGEPLLIGIPSDGAVSTTQLATNAVTTAKITDANITAAKLASVNFDGNTSTDTSNSGNITLDFATNQNFVLTLTGSITLVNPTTEAVGQSGFIVFIQDGTGSRTVSLGTDYETVGGEGVTLSSAASTTDIVPYIVVASSRILLGTPQLAFS